MIEPEEIIEANIVAALVEADTPLEVVGALAAVEPGKEKVAPLSYVGVAVDVTDQDIDWVGPGCPFTYSARISVRVAFCDDKTGMLFRDTARVVRGAISALLGDGCSALDGNGFSCDEFKIDSTSTVLETMGDGEGMSKSYTVTVRGRYNPNNNNETEAING